MRIRATRLSPSGRFIFQINKANTIAAYSLRIISIEYTGPAIRVRRSTDNAEQNISFNSIGELDTTSLLTFCGAGSGFVTTWYDQSGNTRNVTQSTAANQPIIVNAGALTIMGSKPTIQWPSSINSVNLSSPAIFTDPKSHFVVGQFSGPNPFTEVRAAFTIDDGDGSNNGLSFLSNGAGSNTFFRPVHLNNAASSTIVLPTIQSPFIGRNSLTPTPNRFGWWVGGDRGILNRGWRGYISEIIIFSKNLDTLEIDNVQQNMSNYFQIPLV